MKNCVINSPKSTLIGYSDETNKCIWTFRSI